MHRTILLTGGAGFIGSHLAGDLLAEGWRVLILDDLSTGKRENVPPGAELIEGSLETPGLADLLRREQVGVVSHHAAQANVRASVAAPIADAKINILGSLHLIEACRAAGIRRLLFASSGGTVYGRQESFPCAEDHPRRPISPYGCAKLAVEEYLEAYARIGEIEPVILRYANVYGERQDPKGEAGIVAIFAEALLRAEPPCIFGDGSQTRDYVHVSDVTAAHRAILARWQPGAYNVGTGRETSLIDLLRAVSELLGHRIVARHLPANPAELQRNALSPASMDRAFGWQPQIGLRDGLARTLPYYVDKLGVSR